MWLFLAVPWVWFVIFPDHTHYFKEFLLTDNRRTDGHPEHEHTCADPGIFVRGSRSVRQKSSDNVVFF